MAPVAIGSDHAGLSLKKEIVRFLLEEKWEVMDAGTHDSNSVDYPDIARAVGAAILAGRSKKGILICGSGVGASVAANKLKGIRAGLCHDTYSAHQGVEHDDMNILCLGARVVGPEVAKELVSAFLKAEFSGAERHIRRLNKVKQLEGVAGQQTKETQL
jgi:RpiB/LacA/LacB family sugar-phosphate isomerase